MPCSPWRISFLEPQYVVRNRRQTGDDAEFGSNTLMWSSRVNTNVTTTVAGTVLEIRVGIGATVRQGDDIAMLEVMKLEVPVVAPVNGTVVELRMKVGEIVAEGAIVAVIK